MGSTVHPHRCGEHATGTGKTVIAAGSSPRVWGTYGVDLPEHPEPRFIPTGVGNIQKHCPEAKMESVHPHGCGEHLSRGKCASGDDGSSPRVWGTFLHPWFVVWRIRFIPTGVGNMMRMNTFIILIQVHSHGCGEHRPG